MKNSRTTLCHNEIPSRHTGLINRIVTDNETTSLDICVRLIKSIILLPNIWCAITSHKHIRLIKRSITRCYDGKYQNATCFYKMQFEVMNRHLVICNKKNNKNLFKTVRKQMDWNGNRIRWTDFGTSQMSPESYQISLKQRTCRFQNAIRDIQLHFTWRHHHHLGYNRRMKPFSRHF